MISDSFIKFFKKIISEPYIVGSRIMHLHIFIGTSTMQNFKFLRITVYSWIYAHRQTDRQTHTHRYTDQRTEEQCSKSAEN